MKNVAIWRELSVLEIRRNFGSEIEDTASPHYFHLKTVAETDSSAVVYETLTKYPIKTTVNFAGKRHKLYTHTHTHREESNI